MVEIPIYRDDNNMSVCECCHQSVEKTEDVVNTKTSTPIKVCKPCISKNNHLVPIDKCMPSGDVVM